MPSDLGDGIRRAWDVAIENALAAAPTGCEVSVDLRDAAGTVVAQRHSDRRHYAASTLKTAVLVTALAEVDAGRFDLSQQLRIVDTFPSAGPARGVFRMCREDDQDDDTWAAVGNALPAQTLLERMIVRSSNIATNVLVSHLGLAAVAAVLRRAGTPELSFDRLLGDRPAQRSGITNTVTAGGLTLFWTAMTNGELLNPVTAETALRLLARQEHTDMIPAGLPAGTWVASKGGWNDYVQHDAALVRPSAFPSYVLAVCTTTSVAEQQVARRIVTRLSEITWEHWATWHG